MYNDYVVNAIVQARMTSTRLKGKVLLPLDDKSCLQHIVERLRRSKYIDDVIIACTTNEEDQPIVDFCKLHNVRHFRGSEEDVLQRVVDTAKAFDTDIIVEITSDCPCVDWELADEAIEELVDDNVDYVSNVIDRTYARGLDVQVFWTRVLEQVNLEVDNPVDRQHVSTWIYKNPKNEDRFNLSNIYTNFYNTEDIRLTLDTEDDYKLLHRVFEYFKGNEFGYKDIYSLFQRYPEWKLINEHIPQKNYREELERWCMENGKI